jgi:hypothetical protein
MVSSLHVNSNPQFNNQGVNTTMQQRYAKIVTKREGETIFTVQFFDGDTLTVKSSNPNFRAVIEKEQEIREFIDRVDVDNSDAGYTEWCDFDIETLEEYLDELRDLMRVDRAVNRLSGGRVEFRNGQLFIDGQVANTYLSRKIMGLYSDGFGIETYLKFCERLQQNPDARIRGERGDDGDLMAFIDYGNLPLLDDGRFVAYKVVRSDFRDKYTGTMDNSPGNTLELRENEVDNDPDRTCSRGLHACSREYAEGFFFSSGDRLIAVAIAPEDVRAIPKDYNNTKLRCIRYEVLFEISRDDLERDVLAQQSVVTQGRTIQVDGEEDRTTEYFNDEDDLLDRPDVDAIMEFFFGRSAYRL